MGVQRRTNDVIAKLSKRKKDFQCARYVLGASERTPARDLFFTIAQTGKRKRAIVCMPLKKAANNTKRQLDYKIGKLSIRERKRARRELKRSVSKSDDDEAYMIEWIVVKIARFVLEYATPKMVREMFGAADAYTRGWLSTLLKYPAKIAGYLWSNRLTVNLAITLYTIMKMSMCLYFLPQGGKMLLKNWLKERFRDVTKMSTALSAIVDCTTSTIDVGTGIFDSFGLGAVVSIPRMMMSCTRALAEALYVPLTFVREFMHYYFPSKETTVDSMTNVVSITPTEDRSWLGRWIAWVQGSDDVYRMMKEIRIDSVAPNLKFFKRMIVSKLGYRMIRPVFNYIVNILLSYATIFVPSGRFKRRLLKLLRTKNRTKWLDRLFNLVSFAQNIEHVRRILRWVLAEIHGVFRCLVFKENCCFTDATIRQWTKRWNKGSISAETAIKMKSGNETDERKAREAGYTSVQNAKLESIRGHMPEIRDAIAEGSIERPKHTNLRGSLGAKLDKLPPTGDDQSFGEWIGSFFSGGDDDNAKRRLRWLSIVLYRKPRRFSYTFSDGRRRVFRYDPTTDRLRVLAKYRPKSQ